MTSSLLSVAHKQEGIGIGEHNAKSLAHAKMLGTMLNAMGIIHTLESNDNWPAYKWLVRSPSLFDHLVSSPLSVVVRNGLRTIRSSVFPGAQIDYGLHPHDPNLHRFLMHVQEQGHLHYERLLVRELHFERCILMLHRSVPMKLGMSHRSDPLQTSHRWSTLRWLISSLKGCLRESIAWQKTVNE